MEKEYGRLTFGQALWSHRKCEEISQKKFATSLGISSQSLCDIETGRKISSSERAAKKSEKKEKKGDRFIVRPGKAMYFSGCESSLGR